MNACLELVEFSASNKVKKHCFRSLVVSNSMHSYVFMFLGGACVAPFNFCPLSQSGQMFQVQ